MKIDLHSHSTISDGVLTPTEVAERAHANGVQVWALTDHDELSGLADARRTAEALGMTFIPGVEVSVTWAGHTIHVLGLGVDEHSEALNAGLAKTRSGRSVRARLIADKLGEMGVPNSYEGALPYAANPSLISRTHFARFLVAEGHAKNMQAVFDTYLGDGKPANVRMQWATLEEALAWIHAAGGRAAMAHPGRYDYSAMQFDALFQQFKELGGAAIEVVTGSHTPEQYKEYAQVARRYGFMASSGSDFHSPREGKLDLGEIPPLPSDLKPVWHDWI
ncbi:PHP domain-containing protein [Parapusillimonas sp. SGNA-6]|nr:PHP domain-containing protein [Parapusillimonas sp. SGNA-6]